MKPVLVMILTAWLLGPAATSAPAAAEGGLRVDLDRESASTNVVATDELRLSAAANRMESLRTGFAVYRLPVTRPANTFEATVDSTVPPDARLAVDVRARHDGQWSEWTEIRPDAPTTLPAASGTVEVRVMLIAPDGTASPVLRSLTVTPSRTAAAPARAAGPVSYRVFATREGLVGGTTANGHVITRRDHFVALPSRRGLSRDRSGEYSVRVCAANGRCEWAPVWDVGPWNTRDDYWNERREQWRGLPRGLPQAQAAYQNGHNGGKDQFGRQVANPAGIDLADGTFWDGLRLRNNAWVTVTYLWTGGGPAGRVDTHGTPLNVRERPTRHSPNVGFAAEYARVGIQCSVRGDHAEGTQGRTNVWYRLAPGKFVSAAWVAGAAGVRAC
ncbi:hypothetical protein [Actinophytocola gossypii]|uniref:Secreted protein n=1 Tax=Actinophytocola gossypii TaxID=2812003 RepID=A0ABT2JCP6_9PSEU|nr:hypothetical protein [Actinophytocola gossypii]MCT2585643.1 hypothetical protein [Actinophytocola gossypii]